jgi:cytochrome P450
VLLSQYLLHHDARVLPRARIGSIPIAGCRNASATRPRFAYFPFGGGNRVCIGESFAWTEGILVLADAGAPVAAGARRDGAGCR